MSLLMCVNLLGMMMMHVRVRLHQCIDDVKGVEVMMLLLMLLMELLSCVCVSLQINYSSEGL